MVGREGEEVMQAGSRSGEVVRGGRSGGQLCAGGAESQPPSLVVCSCGVVSACTHTSLWR